MVQRSVIDVTTILFLRDAGFSARRIARATGVPYETVRTVVGAVRKARI